MPHRATGTFEVTLTPLATEATPVARMALDKRFHGALQAASRGEMLSIGTEVKNSAAYVALERVTGALDGREGSFSLQHTGVMNRGEGSLTITVVPDSGTGALTGLTGRMQILVEGGAHSYDFEYELPTPP